MAQRGMVIRAGGSNKPWIARYGNGTSPRADPFETLRQAQIPIESGANVPLRWTQVCDGEGTPVSPETWVADDFATAAAVVGGVGPWSYTPGDAMEVLVGTPSIAPTPVLMTLLASPALVDADASGPYTIAPSSTWVVTLTTPQGAQPVSISTNTMTPTLGLSASAAATWLNANAVPMGAGVQFQPNLSTNALELVSVAAGNGVSVTAVGGGTLASSIGFTSVSLASAGTGNVPDASRITVADACSMIRSAASALLQPGVATSGALVLGTNGVGANYSLEVLSGTITFDFDNNIHYGTGP